MSGAERKVKKAEPSIHLGIDSPMVIWHGDITDFQSGPGGGRTSGGGTGRGGPTAPEAPVRGYGAVCHAFVHEPDDTGAVADGVWFGPFHESFQDALNDQGNHTDGGAYVVLYVGDVLIGPVKLS